ncbi:MAG: hypothetical protein WA061_04470 [Microgenomates group bacterium]
MNTNRSLTQQLHHYISAQMMNCMAHYNETKSRNVVQKNFEWAEGFAKQYYSSRTERAEDLLTNEVKQAQDLAWRFIGAGNHDFFVTCVDGRNIPIIMFSKPPHIGGVLRAPAGAVNGFMEGEKPGTVFIDESSYVVQRIVKLLREKAGDTIYYGLDSHFGCAARGQIHATEGGYQVDGGVRTDIVSKLMTARGILQLRKEMKEKGEEIAAIIPTFFSFDPNTGGVVSGLELHIDEEDVAKYGYTAEIVEKLVKKGLIVSTLHLIKDKNVQAVLSNIIKAKSADFRDKFSKSLLSNWIATTTLYADGKGELFQLIYEKLVFAYGRTGWVVGDMDNLATHFISERTLRQKAKFLLKNMVTRYSIAGSEDEWPFNSHSEEMSVITDGGYAPFSDIDAFAVFSRDLNSLLTNTKLTIDLVRNSRRTKKISDPVNNSKLSETEFFSAPVLISNKAILKRVSEASWKTLSSLNINTVLAALDWDDRDVLNWQKSDFEEIIIECAKNNKVPIELHDAYVFIEGLYELFDRIRIMMKDKYFRRMILHGNIVLLNTLVDGNRMPKYIAHFVI